MSGSAVESLVTRGEGQICGRELQRFPFEHSAAMGGYMRGRVYVCGGSSGGFDNLVIHNKCHAALANSPGKGWVAVPSLPMNTTHAAHAVLNNKLYVFGGYQKPACVNHRTTGSKYHRITGSQDHMVTGYRITESQDNRIKLSQDHRITGPHGHRIQDHRIT